MAYLGNDPQKDTVINVKKYIAEEGQATFNAVYQDYVNVTVNGLSIDEYTADDGMTVVLDSALSAGDKVKIEGFSSLAYLDSYVKSETDDLLDAKADTTYVDTQDSLKANLTGAVFTGDVETTTEFKGKNACTAWVNFDGTTTPPTIKDSFNVSSVVRTATGTYTIIFIESMDNANYVMSGACGVSSVSSTVYSLKTGNTDLKTVGSVSVITTSNATTYTSYPENSLIIFGGKN